MASLKWSIQEISSESGESVPVIYDAIKAGHLRTFLVGRRRFARPADVEKWITYLQKQSDAGKPVAYRKRPAERMGA